MHIIRHAGFEWGISKLRCLISFKLCNLFLHKFLNKQKIQGMLICVTTDLFCTTFLKDSPPKNLLKEKVDCFSARLPLGNHGNCRLAQDIKENYIALETFICLDSKFYSNESRITLCAGRVRSVTSTLQQYSLEIRNSVNLWWSATTTAVIAVSSVLLWSRKSLQINKSDFQGNIGRWWLHLSSILAVKRDAVNTGAAPAPSHPCSDAQEKKPSSPHLLFMKMVYLTQKLLACKGGPHPWYLETKSHLSATGIAIIRDDSAFLQGKDDRSCTGLRNWPAEAQHAKKAVTKV